MNPPPPHARLAAPLTITEARAAFADDLAAGLTRTPKTLPSRYFYDEAGSRLFEAICDLPEYYLTRTERSILEAHADDIVSTLEPDARLVELGAGSATKTRILLDALVRRQGHVAYTPIDISEEAMRIAHDNITASFPRTVRFQGLLGEYRDALSRLTRDDGQPKLVLFLGSSIGNFTCEGAARFLRRIRDAIGPDDLVLLGTDLAKSERILLPAYDDAQRVTAAFNKNVLARANRELGAGFDLDAFRHEARWNADESRIEMHLVSARAQTVRVAALDLDIAFRADESIHTENSYKYTDAMIARITQESGLVRLRTWTDPARHFALHLLAPVS